MMTVYLFLYWFFPYCSQSRQLIYENLILEFPKNMIKPPLIWLMYSTLKVDFQIMLGFMKSNFCKALLKKLHKIYSKVTIYINELMLTPLSPFDIKCKKLNLMWKTHGSIFLGYLGERVFQIFPRLHSIMRGVPNTF